MASSLTVKEKRAAMAAKFEATQRSMSSTVDQLSLTKRSAVPFPSTWNGESISEHGPIPTDNHLIPSNMVIKSADASIFKANASQHSSMHISGKPWASYVTPQPSIGPCPSFSGAAVPPPPAAPKPTKVDEEMWRTQYQEWTLQKNAFNPDIAAAMRTNVRKQAMLTVVDPALNQDPARTSENVRAALSHSETTGPAGYVSKQLLAPKHYIPMGK